MKQEPRKGTTGRCASCEKPFGSRERTDVHPTLLRAELEAMESQLADLREELEEYEQLKSADLSVISVAAFDRLADGLLKARIASGLSQRALTQRLELKDQQIQRGPNGMKRTTGRGTDHLLTV